MQVIALHPLTWLTRTLLHDLDEDDSALEARVTAVFIDDVPKLKPYIVIETPPEVGWPEPQVTFNIDGAS
jgi:hypothetical protein